jgi:hypothetical protein
LITRRLAGDFAGVVAETMQALAAPSRVRVLGRLHAGAVSAATGELEDGGEAQRIRQLAIGRTGHHAD